MRLLILTLAAFVASAPTFADLPLLDGSAAPSVMAGFLRVPHGLTRAREWIFGVRSRSLLRVTSVVG